ncbi:hypothetical protein Cob_v000967 [Colletotrichum orbiculare MAFF 240422]|uniref:Chromosome segregation protein n=2 Tax=Colletotrichum orbiculare species complex TaxID=2707354 RepID=N4W141_COLOR|nr:hypothetical protein C8035_v000243 [Colletotrichum spinosum]TDZ25854.1 hypothetical protein Cob_v000967 [Colletotrichum orbiculare MAFF 240422]
MSLSPRPENERHSISLEQSLQELQEKIQEHQKELASLQLNGGQPEHSAIGPGRGRFDVLKGAFEQVAGTPPFLPFSASVLPALLALRKTHQTIAESREYLNSQGASLEQAQRVLEREQANLNDQKLLQESLEKRIQSLKDEANSRMELTPEQAAKERLDELKQKQKHYDKETSRLLKALRKFIDDHLAAQLAAEDLGGPVVGDMMEIDSDQLVAGFNAQGRPMKPKSKPDEDKRQRRLEDVWGLPQQDEREGRGNVDEAAAAGREMRELTEQLLNQLVEAGGDSTAAYVKIPKETAAVRFLIRSKVAQFHPRDATRLKLIDFGRELDD